MVGLRLVALGLLPMVGLTLWEAWRRRQVRRSGVAIPVNAEGFRWVLYTLAAFELGYAGLVIAWLDGTMGREPVPPAALLPVFSTLFATLLLLWHFGERYAPRIPRLRDLRDTCYALHWTLARRGRLLRWQQATGRDVASDLAWSDALEAQYSQQMRWLQDGLALVTFTRRVRWDREALAKLLHIQVEQRRFLLAAQDFLAATAATGLLAPQVAEPATLFA